MRNWFRTGTTKRLSWTDVLPGRVATLAILRSLGDKDACTCRNKQRQPIPGVKSRGHCRYFLALYHVRFLTCLPISPCASFAEGSSESVLTSTKSIPQHQQKFNRLSSVRCRLCGCRCQRAAPATGAGAPQQAGDPRQWPAGLQNQGRPVSSLSHKLDERCKESITLL